MMLLKAVQATQKTVDRFKGKPFHPGAADCIKLVTVHAKHMGKPIKVPKYGSWKAAAAALRKLGYSSLSEAMDAHFERIEPVKALAGDILEVPGGNGFSSMIVAVGNGRAIGFHEDIPHCDILQPMIITGAWRISD